MIARCEALTKKRDRCPHGAGYATPDGALVCHVHAERPRDRRVGDRELRRLAEERRDVVLEGEQRGLW